MQLSSTKLDDEEAERPLRTSLSESNKIHKNRISSSRQSSLTLNRKRNFSDIVNSNCDDIFIASKFQKKENFVNGFNKNSIRDKRKLSLVQKAFSSQEVSTKLSYGGLESATSEDKNDYTDEKPSKTSQNNQRIPGRTRIYKNRVIDLDRYTSKPFFHELQKKDLIETQPKTEHFENAETINCESICDIPKTKTLTGVKRRNSNLITCETPKKKKSYTKEKSLAEEKENSFAENTAAPQSDTSRSNKHKLSLVPIRLQATQSFSSHINSKKSAEYSINSPDFGTNLNKTTENMSVHDYRLIPDDRSSVVGNGLLQRASHSIANDDSAMGLHNHCPTAAPQPCMATLCNIGNTCYLNSVVYTLRFAPQFLHNLHHLVEDLSYVYKTVSKNRAKSSSLGRNINSFHSENSRSLSSRDLASHDILCDSQKSKQQIATEKLHELYQNLNKNERIESMEPFHADSFLRAIQEVSAIFEGNQQQDAHEFLMCVLDSIRETCLDLIKAITEYPDFIANGHISLSEEASIAQSVTKEQEPPPPRQTSSITTKSSFFSRLSKRKDLNKEAKNNQQSTPTKDNVPANNTDLSPEGTPLNSNKNSFNAKSSANENDVWHNDKEQLNEKIKKLGLDFFSEDFEGITVSSTKCLSCETVTEQKETMIDIAVPITSSENFIFTDKFIQNSCITRENFVGENKYRCEKCVGYTEAIRSISYEVLPRLLIIQLSRFSGGMEKISRYIPTPFTLQCFCAKCCELGENKKLHVYKLYSVITHVGATMSVGHYVAYTCYLELANDYVNCNKNAKRQSNLNFANASAASSNNINTNPSSTASTGEKNYALMKKKIFGRSKASSSGDMSKVKNCLPNKTYSNDLGKPAKNAPCDSYNCCGIRVKSNSYNQSSFCNNPSNSIFSDMADDSQSQYTFNHTGYFDATTNRNMGKHKAQTEPIWYMCDDDKIKAMSQHEFEELLSPKRKIMVTPYLLFYARTQMQ